MPPRTTAGQNGLIVGPADSDRYPLNFDLNLAIERMIALRGYRFALRGGLANLTGQAYPTAVNVPAKSTVLILYFSTKSTTVLYLYQDRTFFRPFSL
jgi:hypothetical protein